MKKKKDDMVFNFKVNNRFEIPQISDTYDGLKKKKVEFTPKEYASALYGTGVKDKASFYDVANEKIDIARTYDNFRDKDKRKMTDEEMIKRYGSKYPEFAKINLETAKEVYGEEITINKKEKVSVKEEKIKGFSFVKDVEEFTKDKKEEIKNVNTNDSEFVVNTPVPDMTVSEALDTFGSDKPKGFHFDIKDDLKNVEEEKEPFDLRIIQDDKEEDVDYFNNKTSSNDFSNKHTSIFRGKNVEQNCDFERKIEERNQNLNQERYNQDEVKHIERQEEFANPFVNNNPYEKKEERFSFTSKEEKKDTFDEKPMWESPANDNFNQSNDDYDNNEEESLFIEIKDNPETEIPLIVNPYRDYQFPPMDLFKKSEERSVEEAPWLEEKAEIINQTLQAFGVQGKVRDFVKGPTFTRYEISLDSGVNVRKILNIQDNLQMNLGITSIRIQAPIPGKTTVGIEVPNDKRENVYFGDIISDEFLNDGKPLNVTLGKDIDGNVITTNIASWPHGLVAGGTGSGKSVCMNTILVSLLMKNKPDALKLILIDPKQVEMAPYNDLPHLITPVISDPKMAAQALKWSVEEMNRRYEALKNARVRDIASYNEKVETDPTLQKMSYIVIVIDELADLIMTAGQDVEDAIQKITQKARAAGIHLLVATQRPTTDIVRGSIKTNITARIAFSVSSQVDSFTILDEPGAEALLGRGDMLLKTDRTPVRVQGAYISDSEIGKTCDFIMDQCQPDYIFTHEDLNEKFETTQLSGTSSTQESPEILYQVAKFCIESKSCSVNMIQQQFQFGFNRANRIVQALEQMNIVSRSENKQRRTILVDEQQLMDMFERSE